MADEKKKGRTGVGLDLDFSLNPCAPLLLLLVLPPIALVMVLLLS